MLHSVHNLLQGMPSLSSLTLTHFGVERPIQEWPPTSFPSTTLQMPSLRELKIDFCERAEVQDYICSRWDLPMLTRLTDIPGRTEHRCNALPLIQRFGARLKYLHLFHKLHEGDPIPIDSPSPLASDLGTLCPVIEHLVLPSYQRGTLVVRSQTLLWIDIWSVAPNRNQCITSHHQVQRFISPSSDTPSLRCRRCLIPPKGSKSWPNPLRTREVHWPTVCAPELLWEGGLAGDDHYVAHRFADRWVCQTVSLVTSFSCIYEGSYFEPLAENQSWMTGGARPMVRVKSDVTYKLWDYQEISDIFDLEDRLMVEGSKDVPMEDTDELSELEPQPEVPEYEAETDSESDDTDLDLL